MRISLSDLRENGAIQCHYLMNENFGETPQLIPARAYLISEALLDGIAESENADDPDVEPGDLILFRRGEQGVEMDHLGYQDAFGDPDTHALLERYVIRDPRAENLLRGTLPVVHNFSLTREILHHFQGTENFGVMHAKLLQNINQYADTLSLVMDVNPSDVPGALQTQIHAMRIVDANPNARFEVSIEELSKYFEAKRLRVLIQDHADAHNIPISDNLIPRFQSPTLPVLPENMIRRSVEIRAPLARMAQDPALVRMAASMDRLHHEVFHKITRSNVDDMTIAMVSHNNLTAFMNAMAEEGEPVDGAWIDRMVEEVRSVVSQSMPNYTFTANVFTKDGFDILVVQDSVMGQGGRSGGDRIQSMNDLAAAVYAWPTHDREIVHDYTNRPVSGITPDLIPGNEELAALRELWDEVSLAVAAAAQNYDGPDVP